jgi:hypothetical protein
MDYDIWAFGKIAPGAQRHANTGGHRLPEGQRVGRRDRFNPQSGTDGKSAILDV